MKKRVPHCWKVEEEDGTAYLFAYEYEARDRLHDLEAGGKSGEMWPLYPADPAERAVVRAAVRYIDGGNYTLTRKEARDLFDAVSKLKGTKP